MNATDIAINAYMKIFNSGCRKRFFLSHSSTSSSERRSPRKYKIHVTAIKLGWHRMACHSLTSVNTGETPTEIDNCRQFGDTPFTGIASISHFHKCYVQIVRFAIDIFQFFQHGYAVRMVSLICNRRNFSEIVYRPKKMLLYKSNHLQK